jgi:hypothetical protein
MSHADGCTAATSNSRFHSSNSDLPWLWRQRLKLETPALTYRVDSRHLLARFLLSSGWLRQGEKIMRESITPILYVIIVVAMTLLYVDYDNIELLKHPLNALHSLSTPHDEADED